MGDAKRRRQKHKRTSLIVPSEGELLEHGGVEPEEDGIGDHDDHEALPPRAQAVVPKAKTDLDVSSEIDSLVRVIGSALEADMAKREVRTVSVLAALFRCSSNIAKTYLTQCAKQGMLEDGTADVTKLAEIQDNDLANYIAALNEGMADTGKPN